MKVSLVNSQDHSSKWTIRGLLMALWLSHVIVNFLWLKIDTRPPFWDMAGHAVAALRIARLPFITDFPTAIRGLSTVGAGGYPPLVYLISAPLVFLFGPAVDVLLGGHALFLGILLCSTYGIASAFGGRKSGLLAAFIVSMYPIIYGLTRHYLLEVPLVAMVTLATWLLVCTRDFARRGASIVCGLSLGFGMLTKWTFLVFVGGPFLIVAVRTLRCRSSDRLLNLALALIGGAIVAGPWYLYNLATFPGVLRQAAAYGRAESDPMVFSLGSWLYYLRGLVNDQILLPFALFFVLGLILLLIQRNRGVMTAFLLCWIVLPYLVFSGFGQKDIRFTIPYLPAMAVVTASGFTQFRWPKLRTGMLIFLALYAIFQFAGLSWGLSNRLLAGVLPPRIQVRLGSESILFYTESVHIASPPRSENWQAQFMLHRIVDSATTLTNSRPLMLTVLPDAPFFEPNVFIYYADVEQLPIQIQSVTGVLPINDARTKIFASDYIVTKSGDLGPLWSVQDAGVFTEELEDKVSELGAQFKLIETYPLPDGSIGKLYQHK